MEFFDSHVHAENTNINTNKLLSDLTSAGLSGACVFSNNPKEYNAKTGTDFDTRLSEVLSWTKGNEDKLFPVMWIHPYEENILENVEKASNAGVMAFKIICSNFYVGDTKCMDMLSKITTLNKPVFFHSGILWDGMNSSKYNRPANWEALLDLDNLKFALAHISWPWVDECIAVYGKFLNALNQGRTVEMFIDTTPGTPEIYREDAFKKLFYTGYDVPNNIFFGTDCSAHNYQYEWTKKWLNIDQAIFNKLNIPLKMQQKIFKDNILRFLGKTNDKVNRFIPMPDSLESWSPEMER